VTTLLLARHGETEWNREERYQGHADPPLNDTGRAQAEQLAEHLAAEPIDAVYSSDLRRAAETAQIVGERLGLPVEHEPGLREIDVGSWQGLTKAEIDGRPWDGETYAHHAARVTQALREIAARHPNGRVLIVSHGGSLRRVQATVLGAPLPVVEHCAIWTCSLDDGVLAANP
jgi:2,3-bisphosphoglycerate-dependent phosphoglycerate mutase